ncbi:MAG: LPP20 family lipoprotein [Candidatus Hatepunaea meridiana]|nr:LPP20 family lipoprotein [Candidatus Hatepunaea meridiana]
MKTNLLFLLLIAPFALHASQTDIKSILNNPQYLVGFGENVNYEQADKSALADLSSQISVQIKSSLKIVKTETDLSLSDYSQRVIETYSDAMLTNTMKVAERLENGKYNVYRYIKLTEKDKIFTHRANKIREYVKTGLRAQDADDFTAALRSYYWALILLKSHPDKGSFTMELDGESRLLQVFLPVKIQQLLDEVSIRMSNRIEGAENQELNLAINCKSSPINRLTISYFDGADFISSTVKDGKAVAFVPKDYLKNAKGLDVSIDYVFSERLGDIPLDEEVKMVEKFIHVPFNNRRIIPFKKAKNKEFKPSIQRAKIPDEKKIVKMVEVIVDAIRESDFSNIKDYFSAPGYEQFMKIMNYGNVSIYKGKQDIRFIPCGSQIHIRSIPLVFELTDRNKKIVKDDVVLIYEDGKISWVNFTINDGNVNDAVRRGNEKGDLTERMMGISFMEYYKTIFCLKELPRIAEIFSDSAVIFVGYVKRTEEVPDYLKDVVKKQVSLKQIEHIKFTKTEYLKRLKDKAFSNPFVNIQFSDLDIIRRCKTKPIFAIQLHQDYYSTNYADEGYLLLYMDFSNKDEPKIFFRYWQPGRISEEDQKLFGVTDLKF